MVEARATYQADRDTVWREFAAAMVANLMNATGNMKDPIQVRDLLGTPYLEAELKAKAEELKAHRARKLKQQKKA